MLEVRKENLYSWVIDVQTLRFGLDDRKIRAREKVAEIMGITPERVCQMKRKAIHRMEHNIKTKPVRDFYAQN